jgi:hypothetical protein
MANTWNQKKKRENTKDLCVSFSGNELASSTRNQPNRGGIGILQQENEVGLELRGVNQDRKAVSAALVYTQAFSDASYYIILPYSIHTEHLDEIKLGIYTYRFFEPWQIFQTAVVTFRSYNTKWQAGQISFLHRTRN